jgi:adenosine deaminase
VCAAARDAGFKAVAHAGEEGPAAYVEGAMDDLGVSRVDHGNRAFEDPALIARMVREQMPLTMCPLSNLRLKGISDLGKHPIKKALDAGLLATVNSDDPSYFGGYVNENYKAVVDAVGLDANDVIKLAQNSVVASFVDDGRKQELLDKIASQVERFK